MKLLRRLSLVALLVLTGLVAYLATPRLDLSWLSGERTDWKLAYAPSADVSTSYLPGNEWMPFSLPSDVQQVKLITAPNAVEIARLRDQRAQDPLWRWKYAIDIEAVNLFGRPVLSRTHHLRADLAEVRDPEGRNITPTFYLHEALTPLSSAVIHLNLSGLPEASRVRVRLRSIDPSLSDVSLRMYVPEKVSDRQVSHLWSRLTASRRERLAKGNVFSPELLLENEKRNLMRNSWQPVGPLGTRGVDFRQRDLYVLNDYQGEPLDDSVALAGQHFGGRLLASIPLPESGGPVRLVFQQVQPGATGSSGMPGSNETSEIPVEIRWRGPGPFARSREIFHWRPANTEFRGSFSGGTLELAAPEGFAVRAFFGHGEKAPEITPEPAYERTFVVAEGRTLDYPVRHEGDAATPLRLTLRYLRAAVPPERPPAVDYAFLDGQDKPLARGRIAIAPELSPYDVVFGEPTDIAPTVPVVSYFAVPSRATRLRLLPVEGDKVPILTSVSNRPAGLMHQTKLPSDRFDYDEQKSRLPVWFSLRPETYEALLLAGRSRLLSIQARAPEVMPELLTGNYTWKDLLPDGTWTGRQLLTPREAGGPWREDALPATYVPLIAGASRGLDFPVYRGQRNLAPKLAWIAAGDRPWRGELWIDGRPTQVLQGNAGYGELELLPLPAGRHRIRIDTSAPVRFFISHARAENDAYFTRLAVPTDGRRTYTADLLGGETLTLRLFSPSGQDNPTRFRIRIEGPPPPAMAPLDTWLVNESEVTLKPAPAVDMPVFGTDGQAVDAGQPVFLTIPTRGGGRYRIHVELRDGPGGYLLLTSLSARPQAARRILNEPALEGRLEVRE